MPTTGRAVIPFLLPLPRLNLCMCTHRLKLCTNSSFNVLSEKKKKKKNQQCISEARGQSIPKHLFQNSSALVAASWLPTVATAAFLSHRARGALSFQGGSFQR